MRVFLLAACLFLATLLSAKPADAKFYFGDKETINAIQDVSITGPNNTPLVLAYKTTTKFFLLGLWIEDGGYVFGVKGKMGEYFKFPDDARVKEFQQAGLLPNPLPKYEIPLIEYLLGYSLWIGLLCIGLWIGISNLLQRRKAAA